MADAVLGSGSTAAIVGARTDRPQEASARRPPVLAAVGRLRRLARDRRSPARPGLSVFWPVLQQTAAATIAVLLKNDVGLLPLDAGAGSVVLMGQSTFVDDDCLGGGGSSGLPAGERSRR